MSAHSGLADDVPDGVKRMIGMESAARSEFLAEMGGRFAKRAKHA